MSVQNGERLATKQDLADMYQGILPYLGGMPEMVANKFSRGDLYSTDEKMIGQWIDGKPLYQRSFSQRLTASQSEEIWDFEGCSIVASDFYWTPSQSATGIGASYWSVQPIGIAGLNENVTVSTPTVKMQYHKMTFINNSSGSSGCRILGVVRYTKDSDTAISIGSDTDYSTDEKIIGTWIDGKTIYQKTITFSNITFNSANQYYYSLTGLEIDKAWVVNGFHYGGDYVQRPLDVLGQYKVTTWGIQNSSSPVPNSFYLQSSDGTAINRTFYITIQYTKA